jgi:hypothetical protein
MLWVPGWPGRVAAEPAKEAGQDGGPGRLAGVQ